MGYAYYGTPLGPAGYSVDDICYEAVCKEKIDRGLGSLCGNVPGDEWDEFGCGHWFCDNHLFCPPEGINLQGGGLCSKCSQRNLEEK